MHHNKRPGCRTDSAIEGLPMTLVIVMIVLAITVPLIFGSFRAYDRARVEAELVSEIDAILTTVKMLYTAGPGNSAVVEFSASSGALTSVESVIFGDVPGSPMLSAARYTLRDRPEVVIPATSPSVPMMALNGTAGFAVSAGSYSIIAECVLTDIDLNGDAVSPDAYVRLSLSD